MKKIFVAFVLMLVVNQAHAGFITGVLVGSALSGGDTKKHGTATVVSSDNHDVITCRKFDDGNKCELLGHSKSSKDCYEQSLNDSQCMSAKEYATSAGYSKLYRTGVVFESGKQYLIMEVGN